MTTALADGKPQSLDDVMLAMDIVDTLRHRELVLAKELGGAERKEALIARLKEIYSAQGIAVSDRILEDGVKALEEHRFTYAPPTDSLSVRLARAYINRGRWGPPILLVVGLALFATLAYEFGFARPQAAAAQRAAIELTVDLPRDLAAARDAAYRLADAPARQRIDVAYSAGVAAAKAGDAAAAREALGDLEFLSGVIAQDLSIRVVSRPDEYSGVFRIPDGAPDARNYYLIVEAVDAAGRAHALEIASEEDQKTARVDKWGVRVPEAEFNRVAADKRDDQIIQDADIGAKPKGALLPSYDVAAGGAILEW